MRAIFVTLLTLLTLVPFASAAPANLADARADFDAGQYVECLKKISGAIYGPEGKAGSVTRYDLLMLRGECTLRLKERRLAADAFRTAATLAQNQQDINRYAIATATAQLINASKGTTYQPEAPAGAPAIDIIEPASREKAFAALFADRLADVRPKIDRAIEADKITPIHDILPTIKELYALEFASTGNANQTITLGRAVGKRARDLLTAELKRASSELEQLNLAANELYLTDIRPDAQVITARNLDSTERNELKDLASALVADERVAQQGRWISKRTDGPVHEWEALLSDVSELKDRAQQLWDRK